MVNTAGKIGIFDILRTLPPFMMRRDRGVRANLVSYKSGDLKLTAWLYLPATGKIERAKPAHPLDRPAPDGGALVVGHGGIEGVPSHYDVCLRRLAEAGWTVAAPSFRGEDGSEGEVEFALGEVDDMLACWNAASQLPDVDPRRTWLLGSSHGAMACMLALGRDDLPPEIPGAIAGWGVYNVGGWLDWMEEIDHPMLSEPHFMKMLGLDDSALAARSAIEVADRIERAVFLLHGSKDTLVPPQQMLDMAEAFERSGKRNYDLQLEPGADHEYIWGPDRPEAIDGWSAIMDFIDKHK